MRNKFLPAVFLLTLLAAGFCAQGSGMHVDITDFSITPGSFAQNRAAEFSMSLKCTGNSVSDISARIDIFDSEQNLAGSIKFMDFKMAGGESQTLSQTRGFQNLPAGVYSAYANITYDKTGSASSGFSLFLITPGFGQPNTSELPILCSPRIDCGEWGACDENYSSQFCRHVPACIEQDFFKVKSCEAPDAPALEQKACALFPFLCTQKRENSEIYFCLPPIAMLVLSALYLLLSRMHKKF